jgi:hypothetical protein
MSVPASSDEPFEVIHLGGVEAAIVPIDELHRLRAIARHASPEAIEEAELEEAEKILAQHRAWVAEGCPGAVPHEEFRRMLLGETAG